MAALDSGPRDGKLDLRSAPMTVPSIDGRVFVDITTDPAGHVGPDTRFDTTRTALSRGLVTGEEQSISGSSWGRGSAMTSSFVTATSPATVRSPAGTASAVWSSSTTAQSSPTSDGSGRAGPAPEPTFGGSCRAWSPPERLCGGHADRGSDGDSNGQPCSMFSLFAMARDLPDRSPTGARSRPAPSRSRSAGARNLRYRTCRQECRRHQRCPPIPLHPSWLSSPPPSLVK